LWASVVWLPKSNDRDENHNSSLQSAYSLQIAAKACSAADRRSKS